MSLTSNINAYWCDNLTKIYMKLSNVFLHTNIHTIYLSNISNCYCHDHTWWMAGVVFISLSLLYLLMSSQLYCSSNLLFNAIYISSNFPFGSLTLWLWLAQKIILKIFHFLFCSSSLTTVLLYRQPISAGLCKSALHTSLISSRSSFCFIRCFRTWVWSIYIGGCCSSQNMKSSSIQWMT